MLRKRVAFSIFFILAALAVGTVWVYKSYLAPDQLLPTVRKAVEEALGQPIELEEARVSGVGTVAFGRIQIPSSTSEAGDDPWFEAASGKVRLDLAKLIASRHLSLRVELESPVLTLRNDPISGWNFSRRENRDHSDNVPSDSEAEKPIRKSTSTLDLVLLSTDPIIRVVDPERGSLQIEFADEARIEIRSDKTARMQRVFLNGKGKLEGDLRGGLRGALPQVAKDLLSAVGTAPDFQIASEFGFQGDAWEFASRGSPGLVLRSNGSGLTLSRFRIAGNRDNDGKMTVDTAAIDSATIEAPSWNHPAIERLSVPWTEPPRGALTVGIHDFRFDSSRIGCSLSGIHIRETTLAIESLPWLEVLTPKRGWKLADIDLSGSLEYSIPEGSLRWESGRILFRGGEAGRIETSGRFQSRPRPEWSVRTAVFDFPAPRAQIGDSEVSPGIFSGEMNWVEKSPREGNRDFGAEGTVRLEKGEIGAIRLFGGLDDLLHDEALLSSPFERFGFAFRLDADRVEITDLSLESELLDLTGHGSYGPGRRLEMDLELRPTPKLATTLEDEKESLLVTSVADSKDPVQIRATGNLDNLEYSVIFGAGMKIPIRDLGIHF